MIANQSMAAIFRDNARAITGNAKWTEREHISASTDAGDLSQVMPVVQPSHGGCSGTGHSAAFKITDPYAAYTQPAIGLAWTVVDLLCDGGKQASEVLDDYQPQFTKELYLEKMAQIDRFEVFHEEAAG